MKSLQPFYLFIFFISLINVNSSFSTLIVPSHEFHEIGHSITFYFMKKDSKTMLWHYNAESIPTKDESKRGTTFALIFCVNWLWRCGVTASFWSLFSWNKMQRNDKFHGIHEKWQEVTVVACRHSPSETI